MLVVLNLRIIHLLGAEFLRADGRTDRQADMMKLIDAFRKFANAPKSGECLCFSEFIRYVIMVPYMSILPSGKESLDCVSTRLNTVASLF